MSVEVDEDGYGEIASLEGFLRAMTKFTHEKNKKWWVDIHTGEPLERNVGEILMLTVSELSEAMEGHRKNLKDDKLPQYPMITVELADALIRICDIAGGLGLDLAGAWRDKMVYNASRKDHSHEERLKENGKKY
jgi:NTP pyrophosphatase (non-canonical NTP hydrolase)